MNIDDNIWMIQNPKDKVSKYYTDLVLPSWDKFGYYVKCLIVSGVIHYMNMII